MFRNVPVYRLGRVRYVMRLVVRVVCCTAVWMMPSAGAAGVGHSPR